MQHNQLRSYLILSVFAAVAAPSAWSDTVYKSTDKEGHTTYSSQPPATPAKKAKTVEMDIDPNQNVMPAPPARMPPPVQNQNPSENNATNAPANSVAEAEAALKAAEQAYAAGQEVQPGDFVGRAGGGVGPSQQRINRINELQGAVDEAKAALERARGGRN